MFSITDLPRSDDGLVNRDFLAKHASSSFTLEGYGFHFVDGFSKDPVSGRVCDRLCAAYGSDVSYVPCSRETGEAALAWMARHQVPEQRIARLTGELDELFPVALPEPEPAKAQPMAPPKSVRPATDEDGDLETDQATSRPKGKSK
jgi:hypothetical protein